MDIDKTLSEIEVTSVDVLTEAISISDKLRDIEKQIEQVKETEAYLEKQWWNRLDKCNVYLRLSFPASFPEEDDLWEYRNQHMVVEFSFLPCESCNSPIVITYRWYTTPYYLMNQSRDKPYPREAYTRCITLLKDSKVNTHILNSYGDDLMMELTRKALKGHKVFSKSFI